MDNKLIYKILRYLVQATVVYLLFRFVPKTPIAASDALIITVIVMLTYILLENLCNLYAGNNNTNETFSECNVKCNRIENMSGSSNTTGNNPNDNYNSNNGNNNNNSTPTSNNTMAPHIDTNSNGSMGSTNYNTQNNQQQPNTQNNNNTQYNTQPVNNNNGNMSSSPQQPNNITPTQTYNATTTNNSPAPGNNFQTAVSSPIQNGSNGVNGNQNVRNIQTGLQNGNVQLRNDTIWRVNNSNPAYGNYVPYGDNSSNNSGAGYQYERPEVIQSDMKYSDYNHLPMADNVPNIRDYEYGYSYLPPDKWYPQPPFPPVCVTEKRNQVCPLAPSSVADLKEWTSASKIMQPDGINTNYINDRLNRPQ